MPVVRIVGDTLLDQIHSKIRTSRPARRTLRQKNSAEAVCDHQLWIQRGGNIQQRREHFERMTAPLHVAAEILHCARPIDVSEQRAVTEAQLFKHWAGAQQQLLFLLRHRPAQHVNARLNRCDRHEKDGNRDQRQSHRSYLGSNFQGVRAHFKLRPENTADAASRITVT